jgi:hypothetical protein
LFFSLEKLFVDVFAPLRGDTVTIMYDLPHDDIHDTQEWQERLRKMAEALQRFGKEDGPKPDKSDL